ncbi:MAG: hypothetical protein IKU03_05850 [Bacteroidales bacterium]|nr:hypothetical protein [Bacteroidales bacterium]
MNEDVEKVDKLVGINTPSRRHPVSAWRWILLAVLLLALVIALMQITQQRKETYEYHFNISEDTVERAKVGLEDVSIVHRWTPMGGILPKITLHGVAEVEGTTVRYVQFVYKTDQEREWNVADPTRHKGSSYGLVLRDIPKDRILACMVVAVTKDGRKITSEPYAFHTKRTKD